MALLAVAAAALGARRREAALVAAFLGFCVLGFTWVMWAFPSLPLTQQASLNPIVRLCGSALIPAVLCAPLLLPRLRALGLGRARAPRAARRRSPRRSSSSRWRIPWPSSPSTDARASRAGTTAPTGSPSRPRRSRSSTSAARRSPRRARPATASSPSASSTRRLLADGCGRWKVVNLGVQTAEQLRGHLADARRVGYDPWIERA